MKKQKLIISLIIAIPVFLMLIYLGVTFLAKNNISPVYDYGQYKGIISANGGHSVALKKRWKGIGSWCK